MSAQNYTVFSLRAGGGISTLSFPNATTVLSGQRNTQSVSPVFSYMAGVGVNIPLGGRLSVQPEITYIRKGYEFRLTQPGVNAKGLYYYNYVEVPLFLKIGFAKDRYRLFGFAGPAVSYALNGTFDQSAVSGSNQITQAGKIRFEEGQSTSTTLYYDPDLFRQIDAGLQGGIAIGARIGTGLLMLECRGGLGLLDFSRDEESKYRTAILALSYGITLGSMGSSQ